MAAGGRPPLRPDRRQPAALAASAGVDLRPPAELERRRPRRRLLVDAFIDGLAAHLAPGGRALMTHNSFIGLDRSRAAAARHGLSLRRAPVDPGLCAGGEARAHDAEPRAGGGGRSLHSFGPYTFGEIAHRRVRRPDSHEPAGPRARLCWRSRRCCAHACRGARRRRRTRRWRRLLKEAREHCAAADRPPRAHPVRQAHPVGVRDYYPLFGTRENGTHVGYEPDIARSDRPAPRRRDRVRPRQRRDAHPDAGRGPHRPRARDHGAQHPARRPAPLHPAALLPVRDGAGRPQGAPDQRLERRRHPHHLRHRRQRAPTPSWSRTTPA